MAKIGYVRVSTVQQHEDRQLADMIEKGELDKVFVDKGVCGMSAGSDRPQFSAMMDWVRDSKDHIYIDSIDRCCRSIIEMQKILGHLREKGVTIHFVKEGITIDPTKNDPFTEFIVNVINSFGQMEYRIRAERQKEGIAKARQRNAYKNVGRKKSLSEEQISEIKSRVAEGAKIAPLAREYGISRTSLYAYLKAE